MQDEGSSSYGVTIVKKVPLVDSHLDLAENVTRFGRDLILSATTPYTVL
jgi:hypothetical protein